jgi:hypothetical protein
MLKWFCSTRYGKQPIVLVPLMLHHIQKFKGYHWSDAWHFPSLRSVIHHTQKFKGHHWSDAWHFPSLRHGLTLSPTTTLVWGMCNYLRAHLMVKWLKRMKLRLGFAPFCRYLEMKDPLGNFTYHWSIGRRWRTRSRNLHPLAQKKCMPSKKENVVYWERI